MVYGNFEGRVKFKTSETLDGGRFSGVPWVSGLINGKGRYYNPLTSKSNFISIFHEKKFKVSSFFFHSLLNYY